MTYLATLCLLSFPEIDSWKRGDGEQSGSPVKDSRYYCQSLPANNTAKLLNNSKRIRIFFDTFATILIAHHISKARRFQADSP